MEELLMNIVVKDIKHQHYDHVVDLAKDYRAYVTGDGLNEMMKQFVMRESGKEFEQRKTITQHIIPSVVSNIISVERKVPRSNGMRRVLGYKDSDSLKKADELQDILDKYWGGMTLDDYMATRWIELNDIDPNTFVVIEWSSVDANKEKASPYPYESNSSEAVMFEYDNNILQYLVDRKDILIDDYDGKETEAFKYTLYGPDQTFQARQVFSKEVRQIVNEDNKKFDIDGKIYFRKDEYTYYELEVFKAHNLGIVPAYRAGYKRDEVTDGDTFVSPYNDCVPYLKKTIKANSEQDLTMALHAFPQKIVTAKKCAASNCMDGYVREKGKAIECSVCKGEGFAVHKSSQDIIYVPLPRGTDEQLSLDNMARYITPEVALLEFQRDFIEYLTQECKQAVYNSDVFTRQEIATTATEKTINLDNVYDTLYPLAIDYARNWEFQVNIIAKVTNTSKNLVVSLTFSKDFKFKSKDDYISERKAAKDAGVPDTILRNIDDDIMLIDTADHPQAFKVYKTIQSFDPFSGKSEQEVMIALSSDTVPFEVKVLYNNIGWIFDQIFLEHHDFFTMARKKQDEIVKDKVNEIIETIRPSATKKPTDALAAGGEGAVTAESAELEAKAKLRGTVGGVQGILSINEAVQKGLMNKISASTLLMEIYGFDQPTADKLVLEPDKKKLQNLLETAPNNVNG